MVLKSHDGKDRKNRPISQRGGYKLKEIRQYKRCKYKEANWIIQPGWLDTDMKTPKTNNRCKYKKSGRISQRGRIVKKFHSSFP